MEQYEIKAAVDTMNQTYHAFQEANESRLEEIQHTKQADPLLEEKVNRLNNELTRLQEKMEKAQIANKRSPIAAEMPTSYQDAEHKAAFTAFLRKGIEDGLQQKAMSVTSDVDGGYLVPEYLGEQLIKVMHETSVMRQIANIVTVSSDAVDLLVDKNDAATAWVAETAARTETNTPELIKVNIPVHELYAEPRATQKLLDDARINVEEWLIGKIADKMAKAENAAFFNGDGEGKPTGFLEYDAGTSWETLERFKTGVNGAWAAADPENILLDTMYSLKTNYMDGAVWLLNRSLLADIRKFKLENSYFWQPATVTGQPSTLLGHPVYVTEDMPNKTTGSLSVAFGNFKAGYTIVDRAEVRVLRDPFTTKPYVKFYTTKRVGGDVVNFDAIKLIEFAAVG